MSVSWTSEQILALSPDPASTKAGKDLANLRKWVTLGYDGQIAWGECQGSGKDPYRTQIDTSEPAFKCSCPSRKFPCKHGLGMFLLLASQEKSFTQTEQPAWVQEWVASRAKRVEQKAKKEEEKAEAKLDPTKQAKEAEKQAKRVAEREAKVQAGLENLTLWLHDLLRQGLAAVQSQPYNFWDSMAARLVDAQAPGVARMLREMASIPSSGEGWQARLLARLAKLHLLLEGYKNLAQLPLGTQSDVRTLVGWLQSQEELLTQTGIQDRWTVLGQLIEDDPLAGNNIRAQRIWLLGETTKRHALILNFAFGPQPLDTSLVPGSQLEAEIVFFPSAYPLRGLVKQRQTPRPTTRLSGYAHIEAAIGGYAEALGQQPWLNRFPLLMDQVWLLSTKENWIIKDSLGNYLPVATNFSQGWPALALSGGHPLTVFGEWDGVAFLPISMWAIDQFYLITGV